MTGVSRSCGQNSFMQGFLAKGHLPRMSRQSPQSANDVLVGDNEVKLRAGHRSPGSYLTAEEIPGKPQLGDLLMKVLRPIIAWSV